MSARVSGYWRICDRGAGTMRYWVIGPDGVTVAHFLLLPQAAEFAALQAGGAEVPVVDRSGRQIDMA